MSFFVSHFPASVGKHGGGINVYNGSPRSLTPGSYTFLRSIFMHLVSTIICWQYWKDVISMVRLHQMEPSRGLGLAFMEQAAVLERLI